MRIRVVHGLWVIGTKNDRNLHVSRNSMRQEVSFENPGDLEVHSDRMQKLRFKLSKAVYRVTLNP